MDDPQRQDEDFETLDLQEVFRFLRGGLIPALLIGVAAAVAAFLLARAQDPVYQARATVLMARSTSELQSFGASLVTAPTLDPSAYRAAATSAAQLRTALELAGTSEPDPSQVARLQRSASVSVQDDRSSALIHFDVRADAPEGAADLANGMAEALVAWDKERATTNLQQIVASLQSQIASLDQQIANLRDSEQNFTQDQLDGRVSLRAQQQEQLYYAQTLMNSAVGLLSVLEPAAPPASPVAPVPSRNAVLAFLLGIGLVYGLLLLREALDTRLRDSGDVARVSGLPVLAEFPRMLGGNRRLPREGSNYLRTNLSFTTADAHPKVLLVTSPLQAEGKSSVALSLAESFARNDHRTLLVDADLRKPVLAKEYGLASSAPGRAAPLRAWLESPHDEHAPAHVVLGTGVVMDVVPTYEAAPNPTELLSQGFLPALERWRGEYDVIVIDSAPLLPVADTLTIAPLCTGTIVAASVAATDRRRLTAAVALLSRIGVRMLGTVVTQVEARAGRTEDYGYGYGYGYGAPETDASAPAKTRATDRAAAR